MRVQRTKQSASPRNLTEMSTLLDQLKSMTTVVSDTGDINAIKQYKPTDATTNPSLIAAAAGMPDYQSIVDDVLKNAREKNPNADDKEVAAAKHD